MGSSKTKNTVLSILIISPQRTLGPILIPYFSETPIAKPLKIVLYLSSNLKMQSILVSHRSYAL
jgi:hypothetical protein